MLLDDDPEPPRAQAHQRAGRVDAQAAHESGEQVGVEMTGPGGHAGDRIG